MKTVITDTGINALINAGINGPQIKVTKVKIGSAIIAASPSMTDVTDIVWEGGSEFIQYQIVDEKTFTFKVTLDESIGDFPMGNLGLFLEDGSIFTITSLNTQRTKLANNPPQVGNREIFVIPIQLSGISGLIDVTVIVPDEASIPFVQTEATLPQANLSAYSVYEVMYHTKLKTSVLALRSNNGWLYVKAQTGSEGGTFDQGLFENGVQIGDLVYYDSISGLFKKADGLNDEKGYLGVVGSLWNVISNGIYFNEKWSLVQGTDYFAAGGSNVGKLTTVKNGYYVGKAINEHTLLLGSLATTVLNEIQVINPSNPSEVSYPSEKAVYDYVTKIQNLLQDDINTRALRDMTNVGDVTFQGNITFNRLIRGTARAALWS